MPKLHKAQSRHRACSSPPFKTYVRSLVEYAPQIWSPYQISLIDAMEGIQRSFIKRLPGFANKSYAKRLHILHLQSLEHRRLLFDLILCFNIVRGFTALSFNDFFFLSQNTSTRGHTFIWLSPWSKQTQEIFFSSRIVPIWNSLPRQFVSASSTAKFKYLITNHDLRFFITHPTYIRQIHSPFLITSILFSLAFGYLFV